MAQSPPRLARRSPTGRVRYVNVPRYAHGDAFPQIVRCATHQVLANSILPPSLPWQTMGSDGTDADQLNRGAYVHPTDEGVTGHAGELRHWDGETMDTFWGLAIYEGGVFWLQDPHPCAPPPDYMVNGVPVCVRPEEPSRPIRVEEGWRCIDGVADPPVTPSPEPSHHQTTP